VLICDCRHHFAFDTYELLMFPLINWPALTEPPCKFGSASIPAMVGLALLRASVRIFGPRRYRTDGWAGAGSDLSISDLRGVGVRRRLRDEPELAARPSLRHVHWCVEFVVPRPAC
jgi:hypothetical protein